MAYTHFCTTGNSATCDKRIVPPALMVTETILGLDEIVTCPRCRKTKAFVAAVARQEATLAEANPVEVTDFADEMLDDQDLISRQDEEASRPKTRKARKEKVTGLTADSEEVKAYFARIPAKSHAYAQVVLNWINEGQQGEAPADGLGIKGRAMKRIRTALQSIAAGGSASNVA